MDTTHEDDELTVHEIEEPEEEDVCDDCGEPTDDCECDHETKSGLRKLLDLPKDIWQGTLAKFKAGDHDT